MGQHETLVTLKMAGSWESQTQVERRARKWKTGNGGHHGHAFPKWLGGILGVRDVGFLNSSHRGTGYGRIFGSRDVGFLNGAQQRQWLYISKKDVPFTCRCGTDNKKHFLK